MDGKTVVHIMPGKGFPFVDVTSLTGVPGVLFTSL